MLIRSQDKKTIVNLDNICEIASVSREIYSFCGRNHTQIGAYSTEEKAINVLDMIQEKYETYIGIENGFDGVIGYYDMPKVFQMPQDSEV